MRRIAAGLLSTGILLGALAVPAAAATPARGCPDTAFMTMTFYQFRDYAVASGLPPSGYPAQPGPGWVRVDVNRDGILCIKDMPDNPGTLDGLVFNAVDNVSNH